MNDFLSSLPRVNSNIRILHAVAKAPNIDLYVNGSLIVSNLAFGKISNYTLLTPGEYEFQIYKAGTYDTPILTQNVDLVPNANYTISIVTLSNNLFLFKLKDDNVPVIKTLAFLRFINLSPNAPLLSLSLPNGTVLFNGAEYLETTGYYQVSSGIYNFEVLLGSSEVTAKYIKNLTLDGNKFYTIYIIGLFNDKPPLGYLFVEDLI
ncbi:DUF4397 domain-containing protein [Clostridium celatum]|uniref:DUF4397 domain-containing protein n=1 Tax=Clostridium celatum TaxID=36834 RepID=UPI00189A19BB|nr:DUF4397 domain-containing protein [Clostridium celatum]MCE9656364.1 DUF4397 domain-containing protein [Clostridium celatum]MDU2266374.1 DUF4397 domain-containing protein [Clostridium celatum]MDU3723692.1 DUF4397 domain-containing protein [Clostridium celatum]MDU6296629.1 DUF4397 domain-containing protein [Clostridium celatum]